ncbi:MAG: CRISPR-associated protein Cas6 [Candidatus Competibacter sp.]|nr:CRISPR-associated protein Cas6 [Candidatus Competibacter sp.]
MRRVRICLPRGQVATYRHLDVLHDALIQGWEAAGVSADQVMGYRARPWTFAALGYHRQRTGYAHTLVVATPDPLLAEGLAALKTAAIRYSRASTAEMVDFSAAEIITDLDPVVPGTRGLGVLMLSPLAIGVPGERRRCWIQRLDGMDLAAAINPRLGRLAGRPVTLQIQADSLYLRANPRHSVLVSVKQAPSGQSGFVIGLSAPLVLVGSEADLRLAWYAGLGEKTRTGFGCIGLLEQGVGR